MSDIFDTIKFGAEKAKDGAVNFGKQMVDKTNGFMSLAKIKFAISEEKSKIKDIYTDIGRVIYDNYTKGDYVEDAIREFCEKIDKHSEELMTLQTRADEMSNSIKCPECGENNKKNSTFCSGCGAVLKKNAAEKAYDEAEEVVVIKPVKPEENEDN